MNKTIKLIMIILLSLISLIACTNPLLTDPRIYNKPTNEAQQNENIPNIDINDNIVVTPFDNKSAWFNNPSCNGDESNPYLTNFEATDFDNLALTSWFNIKNVPMYEISYSDVWIKQENIPGNLYAYNGPNTKSKAKDKNSGFNVTNVWYYNNKGHNPLYNADSNKLLAKTKKGAPRLERFNFYSFNGICMKQTLDNYLIAIDTYSKYIFAYAKPTGFKTVLGNQVPTGWGLIDDSELRFYEYDPIGYVLKTEDGKYEIHIYDWFENNLENNDFNGYINPEFTEIATKTQNGAGHSPFYFR